MRSRTLPFVVAALLCGCQPAPVKEPESAPAGKATAAEAPSAPQQEWQPSVLSKQTKDSVMLALTKYRRCVIDQTHKHARDRDDIKQVSEKILESCESKLADIRAPLDAAKAPPPYTDQYVQSKRSQAAQQVLRTVMAQQAARSAKKHR